MKEDDNEKFANVTHYTKVDVQPGGINIQHVEHLHQADVLKALGIELEIKKDGQPLKPATIDDVANRDAISYAQTNIIFNARIFLKEEHYVKLRECILSFVKVDEGASGAEYRIDATSQNEWYYIMKGIKEADVVSRSNFTLTRFVEQMAAWYPDLFILKDGEDKDKMVHRYMSSISRENNKWMAGMDKHEVLIRDMFAHSNTMKYEQARTLRVHGVADGLKKALVAMKAEREKSNR